jgi:sodium/potassium/calcium exchanger 6
MVSKKKFFIIIYFEFFFFFFQLKIFFFFFQGMAVAACFGGPSLNLLLGAGISLTIVNALNFPNPFITNSFFKLMFVAFGFLGANLLLSLLIIPLSSWKIHRIYAILLIAFYAVFVAVSVCVEVNVF